MLITLKSVLCRVLVNLAFGDDPLVAGVWCASNA